MSTILQLLKKPVVAALIVLAAGIFVMERTADRFTLEMAEDRAEMETALRLAQTPEPQIAAISRVLDRVKSNVQSMADTFFSLTIVMVVVCISTAYTPKQKAEPQKEGEMRSVKT